MPGNRAENYCGEPVPVERSSFAARRVAAGRVSVVVFCRASTEICVRGTKFGGDPPSLELGSCVGISDLAGEPKRLAGDGLSGLAGGSDGPTLQHRHG